MHSQNGMTLVEVMIVVAIIALLAAIAIPGLIRAKVIANDTSAKTTLKAMSSATEMYANVNAGTYPGNVTSLTGASPAYLNESYCATTISGFVYACTFNSGSYIFTATPVSVGTSGTTTYTITTGGTLTP